jgi:hypothetical protein
MVYRGVSLSLMTKPFAAKVSPYGLSLGKGVWQVLQVMLYFRAKAGMEKAKPARAEKTMTNPIPILRIRCMEHLLY